MRTRRLLAVLLGSAMVLSFASIVLAEHTGPLVTPTTEAFPGGDPICPEGTTGYRWNDPDDNGTTQGGVTVTWDNDGDKTVSFEATGGVLVVQATVKGSTHQNVYDYSGEPGGGVDHDNGLVAPDNASGGSAGVSHVDLCVTEPEETATPTPTLPEDTATPTLPADTATPTLPPTATSPGSPASPTGTNINLVLGLIVLVAGGLTAFAMRPKRASVKR